MDEPKTPVVCKACGGRSCKWCTNGFQDEDQRREWAEFRRRMRKISATYSLLERVMRELIDRLTEAGTQDARDMASEGQRLLSEWASADPDTKERREASSAIGVFQKKAIRVLLAEKH